MPAYSDLLAADHGGSFRNVSTAPYTPHTPIPQPVSEEEGLAMLDEQAHARLGISGEEFLRRWDAGEYARAEQDRPAVAAVAMLIPLAR